MENIILYLIRHGKTEANEKHLYCGKSDLNLSENGKKELKDIKKEINYIECDKYFTSGAKRANETISILYPGKTYIEIDEFWEYDFGDFELKSYDMLKENKDYIRWITDNEGKVSCPNGESKFQYKMRIEKAFIEFVDRCFKENIKSAVFVSHGGTIGTILEIFYDSKKSFYEHQPACGRGYKIILQKNKDRYIFISVDNI